MQSITHRPTKTTVTVDGDIGIDSSLVRINNWSDSQAELQKGKARRFKLRAFFGKREGPNALEPWSGKCKELALLAEAKLTQIRAQAAPAGNNDEAAARTFAEQKELKRKSAMEKAGAVLQARQEEATKRRCISLGQAPVAATPIANA